MKKRIRIVFLLCLATFSFTLLSMKSIEPNQLPSINIFLAGGNGSPDGGQVNRDYAWGVTYPSNCQLREFRVAYTPGTSLHSLTNDDRLLVVWKPSFSGFMNKIIASCECEGYYGDVYTLEDEITIDLHN